MNSSHKQRITTALVLLPVLAAAVSVRGVFEFAVLAAVSCLGLWEYYTLFWQERFRGYKVAGLLLGLAILTAARAGNPWGILAALIAGHWVANLRFLLRYASCAKDRTEEGEEKALQPEDTGYPLEGVLVSGLLYLPVLLSFFTRMKAIEVVLVLLAVIAADVGAYYAGSLVGGPKVWPEVSPKKTWAGSLGGMAATIALCLAMDAVDEFWLGGAGAGRPWWMWVLLGAALNLAAQFGDFFESALKRRLGVKDSGTILPGHGGILDRIDSLLLAVPVYAGLDALFGFFAR
ncbi:MAG: phosphatidate cytidylyltransferase [Thermodesulfobacteriota bacterium]